MSGSMFATTGTAVCFIAFALASVSAAALSVSVPSPRMDGMIIFSPLASEATEHNEIISSRRAPPASPTPSQTDQNPDRDAEADSQ